jgi:hypothetical protein
MYNFWQKLKTAFIILFQKLFKRGKVKIELYQIGSSDVQALFQLALPGIPVSLADREYNFTTLASWKSILSDCCADNSPYQTDFRDCDDYRDYLKGHVSMDYGINGCLAATGKNDSGYAHAFNVIIYQGEKFPEYTIVEPQTGEVGKNYEIGNIRG